MFRRGHGVCTRRIEYDHATSRGRFHIDIIHSDPGPANNAQLLRRIENFSCDLSLTAHNDSLRITDELKNFAFGQPCADSDFQTIVTGEFVNSAG